jgi:hypothetical protein
VNQAKEKLTENGFHEDRIEINYDVQQLRAGDIYISYDPPEILYSELSMKKDKWHGQNEECDYNQTLSILLSTSFKLSTWYLPSVPSFIDLRIT